MSSILKAFNKYLHYGPLLKIPRRIFKHLMSLIYPLVKQIWKLPEIKTIEETIFKISTERYSIARFGDSEVLYLVDKLNLPYQVYDQRLADKFKEILSAKADNIIVGLPDAFRDLNDFEPPIQTFWRSQISFTYPRFQKYLNLNVTYWNANITRLYYGYIDKSKSTFHFELIRKLWKNRNILLVEGEKSRLGVGNDLFANARQVERILGPAHHAFSKFDELFEEIKKHSNDKLVLIAMGPTAKALAFDITPLGYQAIDIGNLDLEYEWYKRGVKERIKIKGKYTSEVKGGRIVEDVDDELYTSQIIKTII